MGKKIVEEDSGGGKREEEEVEDVEEEVSSGGRLVLPDLPLELVGKVGTAEENMELDMEDSKQVSSQSVSLW